MRKRIYEMIEVSSGDLLSSIYDWVMICTIFISMVPLAFKAETPLFLVIDRVTLVIFIIDYILRLATADYKFGERSVKSFLRYPFTFFAIIDLVSILPSLTVMNNGFKLLRLLRMAKALRVLRIFKSLRYSKTFKLIQNVVARTREPLTAVGTLAIVYILVSALVIFNVEPDSFDTIFDAIYWATVSLTTMGYGDIYPVTTAGRVVTMVSSFFGIAVVALPASIITAGYMRAIGEEQSHKDK